MPIVRQMPKLYLRGSLVNITMSQISEDERQKVHNLVTYVSNHKEMVRHRAEIMKQFRVTIGGDYADDSTAAELEYQIAIWRGVINLFYHRDYTFKCEACQQTQYLTKRGKAKSIDQQLMCCPSCNKVKIAEKGNLTTEEQFIDYDDYRLLLEEGYSGSKIISPIQPIPGERKYENPEAIVNDPKQLKKFFGEFAWNYFRQHLKENKRQEHKKIPQLISGRPDYIISEELASTCSQMNIDYNCAKEDSHYAFHILGMQTPPEFSIEFSKIKEKAIRHGVLLGIDNNTISIQITDESSCQDELEAVVIRPEHVTVLDNQLSVTEDEGGSTLDQIGHRFVEGQKMILEDHVSVIEAEDALSTIRKSLPKGLCQQVYDVLIQNGEVYESFSDRFGAGDPKINHMAEFFGITIRAVNDFRDQIKLVCLSHGLTP